MNECKLNLWVRREIQYSSALMVRLSRTGGSYLRKSVYARKVKTDFEIPHVRKIRQIVHDELRVGLFVSLEALPGFDVDAENRVEIFNEPVMIRDFRVRISLGIFIAFTSESDMDIYCGARPCFDSPVHVHSCLHMYA